jgi:organic hydroperoxide reductase OsmC/OhrA
MAMHPFPHHYRVQARATATSHVMVDAEGLPQIPTNAPPEFGGPPGLWSPETLLAASIADCFLLTFRAIARASRLNWVSLTVDVEAVLEQSEGVTQFTHFTIVPLLTVGPDTNETVALEMLQRAKRSCLITNSLRGKCELAPTVQVIADDEVRAGG